MAPLYGETGSRSSGCQTHDQYRLSSSQGRPRYDPGYCYTIRRLGLDVLRTSLKAPVRGIVNKLKVTSLGSIVQPGRDIIEIVPMDDALHLETRIRPRDVASIRPGQKASIRLTASDFLIYDA
ncbi:MAG: HlyD family efflux transporter periplasmic adaptor subunit [Hyphomicrobiaceae bacterium TMED74]|nr:MAG: HlyD family efflux transporter periplasmic adaptor subunit [Hyphomicrobiaceae bacterium TMED74]